MSCTFSFAASKQIGGGDTVPGRNGLHMSHRQQRGLRGAVKTCTEERTYPAISANGTQIPEHKYQETTEYSSDGQITSTSTSNGDGSEWQTQFTYDASGHLLKTTSGKKCEKPTETIYSYDEKGNLLSIRSGNKDLINPATFRYDEQGRKTKVQVSRPEDYQPNVGQGGSPFEVADRAPNLPGGGSATTIYDEQDRPVEVQIRDAKGELISRALAYL